MKIQKLDEGPSRFTDDYLAEDYVRWRATLDDDVNHYHLSAVDYVETNNSTTIQYNIMFDCAATIVTSKNFRDLSIEELVDAMRARLSRIEQDNEIEAFSFCDEYDDSEEEEEEAAADSPELPRMSVEFVEAFDLTRGYAWSPEFWSVLSASAPFTWGDNNRSMVTASRLLEHVERCAFDCIPSEELDRLIARLEALGETYIDLEN